MQSGAEKTWVEKFSRGARHLPKILLGYMEILFIIVCLDTLQYYFVIINISTDIYSSTNFTDGEYKIFHHRIYNWFYIIGYFFLARIQVSKLTCSSCSSFSDTDSSGIPFVAFPPRRSKSAGAENKISAPCCTESAFSPRNPLLAPVSACSLSYFDSPRCRWSDKYPAWRWTVAVYASSNNYWNKKLDSRIKSPWMSVCSNL